MKSKGFWYFLMTGAIGLWTAATATGLYLHFEGAGLSAWYFLLGVTVLHLSEIPFVSAMLKDKNIGKGEVAVKTFLFGFTWWVPVKKGVFPR